MIALGAAAVVVVVAVVLVLVRSSGPSHGGPLQNPEITGFSLRQHPGDTIGYGVPMAWNVAKAPVVLQSARLIDPTPGMEVVETFVSPPNRKKQGISNSETWPSDEYSDLRPVKGLSLASRFSPAGEKGAMFVFALHFPKLGEFQHAGVEVAYTAGGKQYVMRIPTSLRICVVAKSQDLRGPCAGPDAFDEDHGN